VPQLVNERAGVRIAGVAGWRRRHRYREFRIVSLSVQTGIHYSFRISETKFNRAVIKVN